MVLFKRCLEMNCFPFELGKKVTVNRANPSPDGCPPQPQSAEHKLTPDIGTTGQQAAKTPRPGVLLLHEFCSKPVPQQ